VWVPAGGHDLKFDNLDLSSAGAHAGVFASAGTGAGVSNITISNSRLHGTVGLGVISAQPADRNWTITGNEITDTGDSGLLIFGSNVSITGNTIHAVGTSSAISWARHGIYAKGPDMTIAGNDISDAPNGQAISLRFHGARVYGNSIHDTPYAIGFFDYDTAAAPQGTSYVYSNRLWNITGYGFYYDGQLAPNGQQPTVDFVVASNSFVLAGASEAVNVSPSGSARVTLANNVFSGQYDSALRAASTTTETHNLWYGASRNVPTGTGDVFTSPALAAAPTLALNGASPAVDKGSTTIGGLSYTTACDGLPLHYCGNAPDLGAVETTSTAPVAAPLAISYPTAAAVTGRSFTATVTAPAGTVSVKFLVDGKKSCIATAATFSCTIKVKAGQHQLTVQAADAAGKITSATTTFNAS
jgi:parallel beta helix pectate lyase-like protein/Big-like domain-containing protein